MGRLLLMATGREGMEGSQSHRTEHTLILTFGAVGGGGVEEEMGSIDLWLFA